MLSGEECAVDVNQQFRQAAGEKSTGAPGLFVCQVSRSSPTTQHPHFHTKLASRREDTLNKDKHFIHLSLWVELFSSFAAGCSPRRLGQPFHFRSRRLSAAHSEQKGKTRGCTSGPSEVNINLGWCFCHRDTSSVVATC